MQTENGLGLERKLRSRIKDEYNYAKYQVSKEKLSVSKDFRYPLVGACVDLEIGSSLVRCSESYVCNFGSNSVQGNDLVKIEMNSLDFIPRMTVRKYNFIFLL